MKNKIIKLVAILGIGISFNACNVTDANIVSKNLSKAAEQFEINRRVVFYNGITDKYILSIEGFCSIEDQHRQLEVTCKTGKGKFKKHFLGLSDNVTYFAEQLDSEHVSSNHYRVIFKPQSIISDRDFVGSKKELINAVTPDNKD